MIASSIEWLGWTKSPSLENTAPAASHPCAGSLEKRSPWAVPILLGITQRVPIAVVVALTGEHFGFVSEHFGFVMLTFFSVRFCRGNDRWDLLCWRCFFSDRRDILCWRCFFRNRWVPLYLHLNCPSDYRRGMVTPFL